MNPDHHDADGHDADGQHADGQHADGHHDDATIGSTVDDATDGSTVNAITPVVAVRPLVPTRWMTRRTERPSPRTHKWCRTCGKHRFKARGRCQYCTSPQYYAPQSSFLPLFISAQTNRMRHVLNEMEAQGIKSALGDQWQPYVDYTVDRYFADWYDFFQRGSRKVIKCAGPPTADLSATTGCTHTPPVEVKTWRSAARVSQKLRRLDMDHSVPKELIFDEWKRCIARRGNADFRHTCNISYLNHLLFSVRPHPKWGHPMVVPRCNARCHGSPAKQARLLAVALKELLLLDR